jgi:hypothetical protein
MDKCKVCSAMEPRTIDRLLVMGYGPQFIATRWGLPRHHVKKHRDECLVGQRRLYVETGLLQMVTATPSFVRRGRGSRL